jgi:hypothetical protein
MLTPAQCCAMCKINNTERPCHFFCYTCDYGMCIPCERKLRGTCSMCHTKVYEILNPKKVQNFKNLVNVGVQTEPLEMFTFIDPDDVIERADISLNRRFWEDKLGKQLHFAGTIPTHTERSSLVESLKNFVRNTSTGSFSSLCQEDG